MANPLIANFDTSKTFLGNNRYRSETYTNVTGAEVTLTEGRLMGRKLVGLTVTPQSALVADGSEQPYGVLKGTYVVAIGASQTVSICTHGSVAESKLSFTSPQTLDTVVDEYMTSPATDYDRLGTIRDLIQRNTGIILEGGTELTKIGNQ